MSKHKVMNLNVTLIDIFNFLMYSRVFSPPISIIIFRQIPIALIIYVIFKAYLIWSSNCDNLIKSFLSIIK